MNNRKRVWSALFELWKGISLREAMRIHKADLLAYLDGKHPKELYIPAMNIIINKEDYILLIKLNKAL